jgi:hypothetical protein
VSSDVGAENGTPAGTTVGSRPSADGSSGRPLSDNPEAKRKRDARAAKKADTSSTGGRSGGVAPKGNPVGFGGGVLEHMGGALSPGEARTQLFWGHVGLAKAIRSDIDLHELDEEFNVAGENYAYVANNMLPALRVIIRFIAPVVLVAVLLVIWGHMIAATPWIHRVRDWWQQRGRSDSRESPSPSAAEHTNGYTPRPPAEPPSAADAAATPREPAQTPPPIPRRPLIRGGRHL